MEEVAFNTDENNDIFTSVPENEVLMKSPVHPILHDPFIVEQKNMRGSSYKLHARSFIQHGRQQ